MLNIWEDDGNYVECKYIDLHNILLGMSYPTVMYFPDSQTHIGLALIKADLVVFLIIVYL